MVTELCHVRIMSSLGVACAKCLSYVCLRRETFTSHSIPCIFFSLSLCFGYKVIVHNRILCSVLFLPKENHQCNSEYSV